MRLISPLHLVVNW